MTGWQAINGKWYYMNGSGEMQTGWQAINGRWYYLDGSGAMQTGWQAINGKYYYLAPMEPCIIIHGRRTENMWMVQELGAVNLNTNIQNGIIKKYREKAGKDAAERFAVSFLN